MADIIAEPVVTKKHLDGSFIKPEPVAVEPAPPSNMQTLRRLLGYVAASKLKLILVIGLILLGTFFNVLGPYLFGVGINSYIELGTVDGLGTIVALMVLAAVGGSITLTIQGWLMADIAQNAMYALRRDLFNHIQSLSLRFYDRQPIGELMSRVVNDVDSINQFFTNGVAQFLQSIFLLLGVGIAMLLLSWQLALAVLVIVPVMGALVAFSGRYAGAAFSQLQETLGELNGFTEESISGQRVITAYGQEEAAANNFEVLSDAAREADGSANFLAMTISPATTFLTNLDLALVAIVGGWFAVQGTLLVGTVATFLNYARQFAQPLSQMTQLVNTILQAIAGAERVFQILDEQPQIVDKPDAIAVKKLDGKVTFKHADFSYVPNKQILYDNTFEALPGQMIGLCGPTGAGKSTIINLVTRFYDIQNGDIRVDDKSVYDLQQDTLRRRTGIVLQIPFLFSETVLDNLRYGWLDASDEECIEAAKMANAHEFIERLPDGYHTLLAERGGNLSQGQRQLLTIARAILANPDILILDEATSSVDTRTEKKLQEALLRLMEGRTSFVIAHRLSTIRDAASTIALDRGRIIEFGPHDELMAKKGFYYDLYMKQFKRELMEDL
jgi:ATP-binding cassette subfamily B protein